MQVQSEFEVDHFIKYLNKFNNLCIIKKNFSHNTWDITLSDNSTYSIHYLLWEKIQENVPRLNVIKEVLQ